MTVIQALSTAIMPAIELCEVAAEVSARVPRWQPCGARCTRIIDEQTIELAPEPGVCLDTFWPEGCVASEEWKRNRYWEYQRSFACHSIVSVFAFVMKRLCDSGVQLAHKGQPVVDLLVCNTTEFDVADLLSSCLRLHDPISGVTIPTISTYESQDRLRELGEAACRRLGWGMPADDVESAGKKMKEARPQSYSTCVPHWWLVAIVGSERMHVHVDLCGPTYDRGAFVEHKAFSTPLHVFSTPGYFIRPHPTLAHKFVLTPELSAGDPENTTISLQPMSIRHLRCFHRPDTSAVEITALDTILARELPGADSDAQLIGVFAELCDELLVTAIERGTPVIICNIKSKPELNGCRGRVHSLARDGRVPVLVQGHTSPMKLKPSCIRLLQSRKQYSALEGLRRDYEESPAGKLEAQGRAAAAAAAADKPISAKDKATMQRVLSSPSPGVQKVLDAMHSSKMAFSMFQDPEFESGLRQLLTPPLDQIFPPDARDKFNKGLALAAHPQAQAAIKLINLMKAS